MVRGVCETQTGAKLCTSGGTSEPRVFEDTTEAEVCICPQSVVSVHLQGHLKEGDVTANSKCSVKNITAFHGSSTTFTPPGGLNVVVD